MGTTLTPISVNIPDFTVTPAINTATFPEDIDVYNSELPAIITAQDLLGTQINILIPQLNALENNVTALELSTQSAADIAIAASHFQGTWTNQLTAIPQSWLYNGIVYMVLVPGTASPITTPSNWFAISTASSTTYDNTSSGLTAIQVQAAIDELNTEKSPKSAPIFTGGATIGGVLNLDSSIVFEGSTIDTAQTTLTVTNPTVDRTITLKDESGTVAYLSDIAAIPSAVTGVRQTVQTSSVDTNGFANFISIGTGLNVNIDGTIPVVIHAAGGAISADRLGTISADKTLLLPASSTSYIYESVATDGTCTSGSTTLIPIYQFGGTPAVTNGQFTFNIGEMKGYLGNGTTAPQVWMTFTGEAVAGASTVTSVVTYALNGLYDSGYTATLPSAAVLISKNHNIGVYPLYKKVLTKCTTIDLAYAVGDEIEPYTVSGGVNVVLTPSVTSKVVSVTTGSSNAFAAIVKNTGGSGALTAAYWSYRLIANRGW